MGLVQKGQVDENPQIPEDYYMSEFVSVSSYSRDSDALGVVLKFAVDHEGSSFELPFFAPAKLSVSSDRESSRLAENLRNLGLLDPVLKELGVSDEVLSERQKWIASDRDEFEKLESVLHAVFAGKTVRVNVEDGQGDDDGSQVSKLSKVFMEEE